MFKFAEEHIRILESEERKEFLNDVRILKELEIESEIKDEIFRLADIGAGTGYFAIPLAKAIGSRGIVIALDIQKEMLEYLNDKLEKMRIGNVIPVIMKEYEIPLIENSVDFAFIANVLHEVSDKPRFLGEVKRIMKKGAKLCIIDWEKERSFFKGSEIGPPLYERVEKEHAKELISELFEVSKEFKAGDFHYGIIAVKNR